MRDIVDLHTKCYDRVEYHFSDVYFFIILIIIKDKLFWKGKIYEKAEGKK